MRKKEKIANRRLIKDSSGYDVADDLMSQIWIYSSNPVGVWSATHEKTISHFSDFLVDLKVRNYDFR